MESKSARVNIGKVSDLSLHRLSYMGWAIEITRVLLFQVFGVPNVMLGFFFHFSCIIFYKYGHFYMKKGILDISIRLKSIQKYQIWSSQHN